MKAPVLGYLFYKIVGPKPQDFIKKRFRHRCFPVNVAKFLKTPILKNIKKNFYDRKQDLE